MEQGSGRHSGKLLRWSGKVKMKDVTGNRPIEWDFRKLPQFKPMTSMSTMKALQSFAHKSKQMSIP